MKNIESQIQPLYVGDELMNKLSIFPTIKDRFNGVPDRLVSLLDIYKIFIPNSSTVDIYIRLYLSLLNSLRKKKTIEEVKLYNEIFNGTHGSIGGLDSFRITGNSGIGKTSSIQRCIETIVKNKTIKDSESEREIIPFIVVECPADGSFKSLLLSILEKVDEGLETNYFRVNSTKGMTTDYLLNLVSVVLINSVGVLVIDEVERVANDSVRGTTLINYLTQLVNQTNVSICFIGNESCNVFFSSKEYMSRRTTGINLNKISYGKEFNSFLEELFRYQFTIDKTILDNEMIDIFYKYSNGVPANIISIFVEAQKYVILNNLKRIDVNVVDHIFELFFSNMNPYVGAKKKRSRNDIVSSSTLINKTNVNGLLNETMKISGKNVDLFLKMLAKNIAIDFIKC